MPVTVVRSNAARRPIRAELEALRPHTVHGRRYRVGERYKMHLHLAAPWLDAGDARVVGDAEHDWWGAPGRILQAEPGAAAVHAATPAPGALRIVQGCSYDPGSSAYRLHTAINETTPHASAFIRWHDTNPHCSLRQLDAREQWAVSRNALDTADVIHCHVDYGLLNQLGYVTRRREGQVLVRHYHGSRVGMPQHPILGADLDDELDAVLVGARLTLCALRPGRIQWLPIAIPVARYAAMRAPHGGHAFRVAHSPTVRAIKGTEAFLAACARLSAAGLPVEPVLIEHVSHGEALALKASCDAVFDSFWLGIQGSGLEGGAMGLPVVAGDPDVRALYEAEMGECPYTFADDEHALAEALERLATDRAFYDAEAARVESYVTEVHDYAAVAARYERIITHSSEKKSK